MRAQYIFKAPFLSHEEVRLANLIPNIKDPELDAQECPLLLRVNEDYTVKPVHDFRAFLKVEKDIKLAGAFSRLIKASGHHGKTESNEISSQRGFTYTLKKPKALFQKLCRDEGVRDWLQEQIEDGLDVHFVIGLVTFLDASAAEGATSRNEFQGEGQVPVTEALSGMPLSDALDVNLRGNYAASESGGRRYVAPGEQIFGLRVKKLAFKFFRSKSAESARLDKDTSWEMVVENRAAAEQESEWVDVCLEDEDMANPDDDEDESDDRVQDGDEIVTLLEEENE